LPFVRLMAFITYTQCNVMFDALSQQLRALLGSSVCISLSMLVWNHADIYIAWWSYDIESAIDWKDSGTVRRKIIRHVLGPSRNVFGKCQIHSEQTMIRPCIRKEWDICNLQTTLKGFMREDVINSSPYISTGWGRCCRVIIFLIFWVFIEVFSFPWLLQLIGILIVIYTDILYVSLFFFFFRGYTTMRSTSSFIEVKSRHETCSAWCCFPPPIKWTPPFIFGWQSSSTVVAGRKGASISWQVASLVRAILQEEL
jgi:hypothetical protein